MTKTKYTNIFFNQQIPRLPVRVKKKKILEKFNFAGNLHDPNSYPRINKN